MKARRLPTFTLLVSLASSLAFTPVFPHRVAPFPRCPACSASFSAPALATLRRVSARRGEVVVVKYGGHAMTNDARAAEFAEDIALLQSLGMRPVVVHGGGPQINDMLERLDVTSSFVRGLRVTSPEVMEVVEMVLCGKLNKGISAAINVAGGRAVGLSGKDDSLVLATQKDEELGLVGSIQAPEASPREGGGGGGGERGPGCDARGPPLPEDSRALWPQAVRAPLLQLLLDKGVVPVIAPVATGADGTSYNVNADTMAGAIASALGAANLLLLTDVEGVLDAAPPEGKLVPLLTPGQAQAFCDEGVAVGGMIPKLGTAIAAVHGGCETAVVMDGRVPHCALEFLFGDAPVGTAISETSERGWDGP